MSDRVTDEEITARDLPVRKSTEHGPLIVAAYDFTPVPYDRAKFDALPAPIYDTLSITSPWDGGRVSLPLGDLDILIEGLTELRVELLRRAQNPL
jgi:hypothetical protein